MPPTFNSHGLHLQQSPNTHTYTENSTAITAKQIFPIRVGQGQRERRQSTASDNSKIPVRKTSGSSVGSTPIGQSRASGGRPPHDAPTIPPPPLAQAGLTSGLNVTVLCGKSAIGLKLELNATGPIFYENLCQVIKKRTRRDLNRDVDQVRFTPHKDLYDNCCWVRLSEDSVEHDWAHAVDWLTQLKQEAPSNIYAVVGPDD